jgi:hypothetical protein
VEEYSTMNQFLFFFNIIILRWNFPQITLFGFFVFKNYLFLN